jgi:hypothetical protein
MAVLPPVASGGQAFASGHAEQRLRLPCLDGHDGAHRRLRVGCGQANGATTGGCRSPGTSWQRCCRAPRAAGGRPWASTGALWRAGRSWSGPSARGSWGAALRAPGRRSAGLHGQGSGAHLSSAVRGEMGVSGLARAVPWSKHWSSRFEAH